MNTRRFDVTDPNARDFFAAHGFVVVRDVLDASRLESIDRAWKDVVAEAASTLGDAPERFVQRFPQNRDLWQKHAAFRALLFETGQANVASTFLGVSGVRLLHDHAIIKPVSGSSTIPWHQDSAYWPVDRAGISLWTPTLDVGVTSGCLTVLDASHRDGPCAPRDFLDDADSAWQDADPRRVHLPVSAGETAILHGLTWHSSAPNTSDVDRLAYLSLWIPSSARFMPAHASWHPTVANVSVAPGERMAGEWFPMFGVEPDLDEGEAVAFPPAAVRRGPSMFTANKQIAAHIAWLTRREVAPLSALFAGCAPEAVADAAIAAGITAASARAECLEVCRELIENDEVRRRSVARDVYLGTVQRWWQIAGARINELMVADDVH